MVDMVPHDRQQVPHPSLYRLDPFGVLWQPRRKFGGGKLDGDDFAADHVLSHAAGGKSAIENFLPAHGLCNGSRWFYSAEEFKWILRMGVCQPAWPCETHVIVLFLISQPVLSFRRKWLFKRPVSGLLGIPSSWMPEAWNRN
jgi:hypothetical protein